MGKNTRPHEKGLLQEKKNLQNLPAVGLEPCVSLAESVLTTRLFQICSENVFVIKSSFLESGRKNVKMEKSPKR
jgi:hypothetical protein